MLKAAIAIGVASVVFPLTCFALVVAVNLLLRLTQTAYAIGDNAEMVLVALTLIAACYTTRGAYRFVIQRTHTH